MNNIIDVIQLLALFAFVFGCMIGIGWLMAYDHVHYLVVAAMVILIGVALGNR